MDVKPLFLNLGVVRRVRKGSKISRFFRHFFEHSKIKRLLGTNLAIMIIASSFIPGQTVTSSSMEENPITLAPVVLTTERATQYPVEKVIINQGYRFFHPALDLEGITGDKVKPIKNGVVEAVSYSKYAYGKAILINHGGELTSLYAHLSKINAKRGDKVTTRDIIGEIGSTGKSSGDHLHLEVRKNGKPINPSTVLPR